VSSTDLKSADSRGLLFDVFLVVLLGAVKIRCHLDRDKLSKCPFFLAGRLGQLLLLLGVAKDGRSVLGSRVPGITGVVDPEEVVQELLVGPLVAVEGHPDGLGVVLDVPIGGVLVGRIVRVPGGTPRVADDRFDNALLAIEIALRAPESSHGRLEGRVDVLGRWDEGTDLSGLGLLGGYHVVVVGSALHYAALKFSALVVVILVAVAAVDCDCLLGNSGMVIVS